MPALARLDAPDADGVPVLAYSVRGAVDGDDIDDFQDELERHERVRLLVRLDEFEVPQGGAFLRKMALLGAGALGTIERYAVVGGPGWVGPYVRVSNAVTPFPIRHFDAEGEAREWIGGAATPGERERRVRAAERAQPAAVLLDGGRPDLVAIAVDGRLDEDDYDDVIEPAVERAARAHGTIDLLVRFDALDGFTLGALKEDAALAEHARAFRRVAIVGGPGWLGGLVEAVGRVAPADVERFEDEGAARAWLDSPA